eukprot:gene32947-biopygen119734
MVLAHATHRGGMLSNKKHFAEREPTLLACASPARQTGTRLRRGAQRLAGALQPCPGTDVLDARGVDSAAYVASTGEWACGSCKFLNNPINGVCGGQGALGCKSPRFSGKGIPRSRLSQVGPPVCCMFLQGKCIFEDKCRHKHEDDGMRQDSLESTGVCGSACRKRCSALGAPILWVNSTQ